VGYLRIQDFPVPALYDDVLTELNHFNDLALKGLILDLRANSGGRTDVGSRVASLFLERDTPIYLSTSRRGQTSARRATPPNQVWTRPVTVLIDGGTASMGEILAATLQEQGVAQLVGETTAGAVAGSIVIPLIDGSALQVTTVRIDSGLGRILNNIGVEPDINIPMVPEDLRGGADPQLDVAMSVLRAQINTAGVPAAPGPAMVGPAAIGG
jgi:carboxyl-terminal processing protease